jgi:P-type Ca2+ transporter type 2C
LPDARAHRLDLRQISSSGLMKIKCRRPGRRDSDRSMAARFDQPREPHAGLSDEEAAARLKRDGPNRIVQQGRRGIGRIALGVVTQPMFLLLLVTALVYAVVGSIGDALVLLASVVAVAAISLVQEARTERVLESLKELSSPRARVLRSGRVLHIASQELVVGDHLLIAEGDRLACDATLTQVNGLLVDESMLTGESAPVLKAAAAPGADAAPAAPLGADPAPAAAPADAQTAPHQVHAGTLVVQGDALGIVSEIGMRTALGKIGGTLARIEPRPSRAQAELKRIVLRVAAFAVLSCGVAALLYTARAGSWVDGLLAGLTLAMAIIPEEFAVVWTVMLALGAWRLAQRSVLTRQAQAIEALGTTTVLCVDKTGTLTVNRMELVALALARQAPVAVPDGAADVRFKNLLSAAALASTDDGLEPMDRALLRLHERWFGPPPAPGVLLERRGVAPERPIFSQRWRGAGGEVLAVKGAPEAVLASCAGVDAALASSLAAQAEQLARQGLRVLGVARSDADSLVLHWCGLLGFLDPVRDDVPAAIATCRQAGMRVVMITGDAPATAVAIARAAGLDGQLADAGVTGEADSGVLTGAQLARMSDADLEAAAAHTPIYARVSYEHKLRIVRALQRRGEIVAMTGDGVNDASALRAADIGVAMGKRGTDVAREAASLVLLDDSFGALVIAVRLGRRIFGNLRNAVGYLLAVHVPIVGVSLLPVLAGTPVLLLPLHVVLLELIIDPACSLVFEAEPEPDDCMTRPPRPAHVGLVSRPSVLRALGIGLAALLGLVIVVMLTQWGGLAADWMRLATLGALVVGNLLMLQRYRYAAGAHETRHGNRAFAWLLAGVALACAVIVFAAPFVPQLGLPDDASLRVAGAAFVVLGAALAYRARRMLAGEPAQ